MALIYYPDTRPGISRQRRGRGFTYIAPDGTRVDSSGERARIKALAVPPAYENVWICPRHDGHLQATGRDARARKQYRYHPDWTRQRALKKYDGLAEFGHTLPRLRRWIASRLTGGAGEPDTAVAAVLALIDRASLRVGHPDYTADNGSYAATTLRNRHVAFDGTKVVLNYTAKGGKKVGKTIQSRQLQRVLQRSADLPGDELISWRDDRGDMHAVRSEQIHQVLADLCGDGVSAKTLRTWNGSHAAFLVALNDEKLTIKAMANAAAERLHNTPAIARSSYIHPKVIDLAEIDAEERLSRLGVLKPAANRDQYRLGEVELRDYLG